MANPVCPIHGIITCPRCAGATGGRSKSPRKLRAATRTIRRVNARRAKEASS